jgi:hypothetical protein
VTDPRTAGALALLAAAFGITVIAGDAAGDRQASFWSPSFRPPAQVRHDGRPVELGLRFVPLRPGTLSAVRFFQAAGAAGPHTASLWDAGGTLRRRVSIPARTGAGWVQAGPLPVDAGREYTVSYHSASGTYPVVPGFFTGRPRRSGPLYAGPDGSGVFRYGGSAFPAETYRGNNYLVDVVFRYRPGRASEAPAPPAAARPLPPPGQSPPGQSPPVTAEVGPGYYARWRNGPPADPGRFPITVWTQDPRRLRDGRTNALNYRDLGINTFVGLYRWPPDAGQLDALAAAGLTVLAGDGSPGAVRQVRAHPRAGLVRGYVLFDEPDMNQPDGTAQGGGCIAPGTVAQRAAAARQADPSRPVYINFGKGMAQPVYLAPGCDNSAAALAAYAQACDICSVDLYPISDPYQPADRKGVYAVGVAVDRLRQATGGRKPVWGVVETTRIFAGGVEAATPGQVRSLVWMEIIHGARGIGYFAHEFRHDGLTEDALLADGRMRAEVRGINAQLSDLAPVLNAPTVLGELTVAVSPLPPVSPVSPAPPGAGGGAVPVDTLVRRHGGATYLFAIGSGTPARPHGAAARATFRLRGAASGTVEVLGEGRRLTLSDGAFSDTFGPYQVHLYKITS